MKSLAALAALDENTVTPSVLESTTTGNLNTVIKDFDISRISHLTEKSDRRYADGQSGMPGDIKPKKMDWKFLSKNTAIITKKDEQLLGFDPTNEVYKHYTDVPSTDEIYRYLLDAKRARQLFAASKKSEFDKIQSEKRTDRVSRMSMSRVAEKELAAAKRAAERRLSRGRDDEIQKLVDIVRKPIFQKTRAECIEVRDWILEKSRKESIIYTFLSQLKDDPEGLVESLEFVRGLKYQLFNRDEPIIRQHEVGYMYFILLSGKVRIHVNKNLWSDEIADERSVGRLGMGQVVDTCGPGAVCSF